MENIDFKPLYDAWVESYYSWCEALYDHKIMWWKHMQTIAPEMIDMWEGAKKEVNNKRKSTNSSSS